MILKSTRIKFTKSSNRNYSAISNVIFASENGGIVTIAKSSCILLMLDRLTHAKF